MRKGALLVGLVVFWTVAVGAGFVQLLEYANAPGAGGKLPEHWPGDTTLAADPDRANLLLFAHPHCPCTRASLEELDKLMAQLPGQLTAQVLFYRPSDFPADWEQTDLWRRAAATPGVRAVADEDGVEARRFGAVTSGQVLVYDRAGRLLFSGGITNARGHAGDSNGSAAIYSLLTQGSGHQTATPVFGCPLCGPRSPHGSGDEQCCK